MAEREGFAQRELEHPLRPWRERDQACRDLVAGAHDAAELGARVFEADAERLEHARRHALLLAKQAEEEVLRPDVVVLEAASLVLGEDDHLTGSLGESLEHPRLRG